MEECIEDCTCDREMTEEEHCTQLRNEVRDLGARVLSLKDKYKNREDAFSGQTGEMIANVMLAYRHMEDARMRIGKVMQQMQGGVSIFDKPEQAKV